MTTQSAILRITAMSIDSVIITGEQVARIRVLLDLDLRTELELHNLRNEVVMTLSDAAGDARRDHDWTAFDRLHTTMSAITAVIDETLWNRCGRI